MLNTTKNKTIGLSLELNSVQDGLHPFIYIHEAEDVMWPDVLQRSKHLQWLTLLVTWVPVLIGTYFRYILYDYIFEQYKKKELTLVNKISLVISLTHHLQIIMVSLTTTLMILHGDNLSNVAGGYWFCTIFLHYNPYALCYQYVGSLGLSIYRILMIKYTYWAKDVIHNKLMCNLILYGGIFLTIIFTTIFRSNDYTKLRQDSCNFVPKMALLQTLDEYEQSRGNLSIASYYFKGTIINGVFMLLMSIAEIITYVFFFRHMHKHDNNNTLRRLLEPRVIKARNRRNAITFFGQFCSFVFKFTVMVLLMLAYSVGTENQTLPTVAITYKRISFPLIAIIEVLTSNVLRKRLPNIYLYNIIFGLY